MTTPERRRFARKTALDARNALSMQIDGSDATNMQKQSMRLSLVALWESAKDAWSVDEGGPVYPSLQTSVTDDDKEEP